MIPAIARTNDCPLPATQATTLSAPRPMHEAVVLTAGGSLADIQLGDQVYTLRITRAGKLILTK